MPVPSTLSSVPAQTPYIQYVATSGQTVFPYPFEVTQDADLVVVVNGVTQNTDSGYSLSGVGDSNGGDLTFTSGRTVGDIVTLFRDITIERVTQIGQNSGFSSTTFNAEFNNIYLILQQLANSIGFALQIPNTNNPAPTVVLTPAAYANKYLSFDANGNPQPAVLTADGTVTQALITGLLRPQTAIEAAAGAVVANELYWMGDVRRYGAVGDGTTDDSQAFAYAALVSGTYPMLIPKTANGYKIDSPFVLPTGATMIGLGRPQLIASVDGTHICSATSGSEITISGVLFKGTSSSTAPLDGFGGFSADNTGLFTASNCDDVRVKDCEFSTFYNGVTLQGCTRVWVDDNVVTTYRNSGILLPDTGYAHVHQNDILNCTQTGAHVAYGIQATGDNAGGSPNTRFDCVGNFIDTVESWFAIESHDFDRYIIIGNDCNNVRGGINLGHLVSTNVDTYATVIGNTIYATTTDTWAAAGAEHGGISMEGFDATHRLSGAVIQGNTIRNFFNITGATFTSFSGNIVVAYSDDVNVSGNTVAAAGAASQSSGIYVFGTCKRVTLGTNSLQGDFTRGAVRLESVISDLITISGVSSLMTTTSDVAISITATTATLCVGHNPTNSTTAYEDDGDTSTLTFIGGTPRLSFTLTLSGGTATDPTGTAVAQVIDDVVVLELPSILATSNATTQPVLSGLPASLQPVDTQHCIGLCQDNSATGISQIKVNTDGTLTLFIGAASTFTSSGTKGVVNSTITYRRAT